MVKYIALEQEIYSLFYQCLRKTKQVYPKFNTKHIKVKINYNMRTTYGKAWLQKNLIEINPHIAKLCKKELKNTIIHEIAHLITYNLFNYVGHKGPWERVMDALGETPSRTGNLDIEHLRRKNRQVVVTCKCSKHKTITKNKATRIKKALKNGTTYACKTCNKTVTIGDILNV